MTHLPDVVERPAWWWQASCHSLLQQDASVQSFTDDPAWLVPARRQPNPPSVAYWLARL